MHTNLSQIFKREKPKPKEKLSTALNGQWVGAYEGSNSGRIVIDLDDMGNHYRGTVCLYESVANLPSTMTVIETADKSIRQNLKIGPIWVIRPDNGDPTEWTEEIRAKYFPDVVAMPKTAEASISLKGDFLELSWKTDVNTYGKACLPRSKAGGISDYNAISEVKTWDEFKSYVDKLDHRRFIFRGQSRPFKLRTSFHRSGRADLRRYNFEDIPTLYRHLSSKTSQLFLIDIPDHRGAFLNLIQHHGYPTPLLDWSYSPYVAAYFAFNEIRASESENSDEKVRLFVFDKKQWLNLGQWHRVVEHTPHFSIIEFIAISNDRMIPQQSISSITNVDDIEQHINNIEKQLNKKFLHVIELPHSERKRVMRELSTMGITAGSLFPGLDGMCEELRERNFSL